MSIRPFSQGDEEFDNPIIYYHVTSGAVLVRREANAVWLLNSANQTFMGPI